MTGGVPSVVGATSAYELWVRTLRLWQEDPDVPLNALPALNESSLPPVSWDRFVEHLRKALERSMARWQESFVTSLAREHDDFRRGAVMVDARRALAKRLLLGRHPGLPEKLRTAVWDTIAQNVDDAQTQLEEFAQRSTSGINPMQASHDLRFFRTHSLTVILAPGFPLEAFASGQHDAPATPPPRTVPGEPGARGFGSLPPGLASSRPRTIRF